MYFSHIGRIHQPPASATLPALAENTFGRSMVQKPNLRAILRGASIAWIAGSLLLSACSSKAPDHPFLPWDITVHPDGTSSVFGLNLDKDSLLEFKRLYDKKADLAIFLDPDKHATLEAYFGSTDVGALTANVALVAKVDQKLLQDWIRHNPESPDPTPSGAWKYSMSDEQVREAQNFPTESITYKPATDYSIDLIERRFGKPAQMIVQDKNTQFWLYPNKGLVITVNPEGKDLFQYISPKDFGLLTASLPKPKAAASPP
ncbi:hypothetical protein [Halothiobacillus sp. DCM-1]|uniref:hypothetical protein n=1 Tax=Halothiobacillus sp. DCM-1 TaxID=3112558 RepID=UPI00324C05C4